MSNRSILHRFRGWLLLVFIYYLAAAASFGGFILKWQLSENTPYTLPMMLDGVAERPFVYRQLLPTTANELGKLIPERAQAAFLKKLAEDPPVSNPIHRYFPNASDSANPHYALRYFIVYALTFLSMFAAMFLLRAVCIELLHDRVAATLTPLVIALILPLIQTEGGYFYDMPELMFMALGMWLAARGQMIRLALVTLVATLNKESYLLFVMSLAPFIMMRYPLKRAATVTGGLLVLAGAVNWVIKHKYAFNSGSVMEYQLMSHVEYLVNPRNYLRMEMNYGVLTTKGFHVLNVLLAILVFKTGWRSLPKTARYHAWIAAVLTVPLFIAFCYRDELRNLSLMWMTFSLVICATISTALSEASGRDRKESPVKIAERDRPASAPRAEAVAATQSSL
ncbi:hypothetical protein [Caballeronia ptereochthonis]|uniref:Glycosyltransferase RgtA/B/C/D-like domain-containing protein n=1 Tax=Caballeronia ptereochthonis TaxID=1777144 RepID=A0A158BJV6_9BURK|nr:hypothetical protein [Caballeronia ptereochthonis]SAK69617.1 hypothetical protein AWB83_03276 [Caballeronia ptereochthonis]